MKTLYFFFLIFPAWLFAQSVRRQLPARPQTSSPQMRERTFVQADTLHPGISTIILKKSINVKNIVGYKVSGYVRKPNGLAIPGFLIQVQGRNLSVVTANDGSYQLILNKDEVLEFSHPGYVTIVINPFSDSRFDNSLMSISLTVTEQAMHSLQTITLPLKIFPVPYPSPSGIYSLDKQLFSGFTSLENVNTILTRALDNCGYDERRYYYAAHGFALITEMEQTSEKGVSLSPPERWSARISQEVNDPLEYLKALFVVPQGYFRVFVFLVTDTDPSASGGGISEDDARKWLGLGYTSLPDEIKQIQLTSAHNFNLLIYQYKKEPGNPGVQIQELTAKEHFFQSHLSLYLSEK